MPIVHFSEYQQEIIKAVQAKEDSGAFKHPGDTNLSVLDKFVMIPVQASIGGGINLGSAVPSVAVIGLDSGQIYYFILKELAPDIYRKAFGDG